MIFDIKINDFVPLFFCWGDEMILLFFRSLRLTEPFNAVLCVDSRLNAVLCIEL
jgi:hypothetical protein